MAVSNKDIFAWFSLAKVDVKANPPSLPVSSTTREALARQERERFEESRRKSHVQDTHDEFEEDEEEDLDIDRYMYMMGPQEQNSLPATTSVFDSYDFSNNLNPVLPTLDYKQQIIDTIESNSVTVIQGCTGSGKSTQVPQYILEKYARERRYCNIICTQPRRIAATSVAKFVADMRQWRLGSLVGYQIAMDKLISEDTRLTFVTTGVLLQKLINMQNMNQYTHVILDEVHDRDKDTDFCLLLVKTFLKTNSRNVKVILMSATLESTKFANYFKEIVRLPNKEKRHIAAPILNIDIQPYEVIDFFRESICSFEGLGKYDIVHDTEPRIDRSTYQLACDLISYFDDEEKKNNERQGSVLVFLPGMPEIQVLHALLNKTSIKNLTIVPLHSSISSSEQQKVFLDPEQGMRKVILATNIAESSITVPDIKYVIDFCLVKELTLDKLTNYQSLKMQWASKASLAQRKGRAGRVSNGRCYRLITETFYHSFNDFSEPEIRRVPLESLVLHAKQMNIDTPRRILKQAITPPNLDGIAKAVINLKEVGALTLKLNGKIDPHDGDLTQFGEILASLPVDIKVGKLLILGHVFGILEDCLIIAAALSLKPLFTIPYDDEGMMSYKSKMSWAEYSFSDCIALLNAYKEWLRRKNMKEFKNSERLEREWCERNFIKKNVIREVSELISELAERLRAFNITAFNQFTYKYNKRQEERNILILKLVIAGAFYPNYFRWGVADEEQAIRDMSGHDPLTTVMVTGLPANPSRYDKNIVSLFRDCGEGKSIHFESTRAYLEFQRPHHSCGRDFVNGVIDAVYVALKKKHGRHPLFIEVEDDDGTGSRALSGGNIVHTQHNDIPPPRTPKQGIHPVTVTQVDNPGHFWVQYCNEASQAVLKQLTDELRVTTLCPMFNKMRPDEMQGQFCLALYKVDKAYYRGYVKSVSGNDAEVFFVDYGNEETVPLDFICILPSSLRATPMQAFECYLAEVKPAIDKTGQARWTKEDKEEFMGMVMEKMLFLQVYSEVSGTLKVVLMDTNGEIDLNIKDLLIQKRMAVPCEEGFQSKQARENLKNMCLPQKPSDLKHDTSVPWVLPNVPLRRGGRRIPIKGPLNPYEVSFQSITRSGGLRTVKVESDSVNSIVVDSEPQDKHERLMVASHINIGSMGDVLLTRNTTLLPNIHGLTHVVCMIFAPMIELRTDELKRQYTGALCGMGFCPNTGMSIYPDHDIELIFDCLITQRDIAEINKVRHAINLSMSADSEWGKPAMKKIQEKARECLLDVIIKARPDVLPTPAVSFGWNKISPEWVVTPEVPSISKKGFPPLLPLHNGIAISNEIIKPSKPAERVMLLNRIEAMERKAYKSHDPEMLFCDLCRIYLGSAHELLVHLKTPKHQRLKKQLKLELLSAETSDQPIPTLNDI